MKSNEGVYHVLLLLPDRVGIHVHTITIYIDIFKCDDKIKDPRKKKRKATAYLLPDCVCMYFSQVEIFLPSTHSAVVLKLNKSLCIESSRPIVM
jgi:hypothetical protein